MKSIKRVRAGGALVVYLVAGLPATAHAADPAASPVTAAFVELREQGADAELVVILHNRGAAAVTTVGYGCWTEERKSAAGGAVEGSRFMAFNTGTLTWSGELAAGAKLTVARVIEGMPGMMVPRLKDQQFQCKAEVR